MNRLSLFMMMILLIIGGFHELYAQAPGKTPHSPSSEKPAQEKKISEEALKHYRAGRELFTRGLPEEAIGEYRKALDIAPDFDYAWGSLGHVYYGLEKYEEAARCFDSAVKYNPADDFYYGENALVQLKLGNRAKALEMLKTAMQLAPDNWVHYYNLGGIQIDDKAIDEGRKNLEQALKLCKSRQWRRIIREKLTSLKPQEKPAEKPAEKP